MSSDRAIAGMQEIVEIRVVRMDGSDPA